MNMIKSAASAGAVERPIAQAARQLDKYDKLAYSTRVIVAFGGMLRGRRQNIDY